MKSLKKLTASLLAGVCLAGFTGCNLPFDLPFDLPFLDNGGKNPPAQTVKAEKISSALLDGKVANLMSASGLGIQEKDESQTASAVATSSRLIVASADGEKMKQPVHELVKAMGNEIHDVRFHKADKGSYRHWNKRFSKHHHKQVAQAIYNLQRYLRQLSRFDPDIPSVDEDGISLK